ncbi:MAG: DUF6498-containing protein [Gammaproteobacteria bacterium]|nr:DUF6498-containing protein [Gammaproteobacteria bacterium]
MERTESINLTGQLASDRSMVVLLLSNLVTIALAVYQQWDVFVLMWVYWGQSVIIGYFNVRRILDLKKFSTSGFKINNRSVKPTPETQRQTAVFFALHYGIFHFAYVVFLTADTKVAGGFPVFNVLVCIGVFYLNHWFSYRYNREQEQDRVPNIGNIMFFPYIRIIPMHLMIVAGVSALGGSAGALIVFLLLKTAADVAMHVVEHAMARAAAHRATRHLP